MKITQVQAKILPTPLKEPRRIASSVMPKMYVALVLLRIDSRLTGVGECLTRFAPSA